jgi:hypothetical protein
MPQWNGFGAGWRGLSGSYQPRASFAANLCTAPKDTLRVAKRAREESKGGNPTWPHLKALKHDSEKVMLVFDCNGTLTSLTEVRKSRGFGVRPGVESLLQLSHSNKFSLALWTSAMKPNLEKMQRQIEGAAAIKFDCALHRAHCVPAPPDVRRKKKFETVKPLHEYFGDGPGPGLSKVILIDDNADKVMESETANLLLVPAWKEQRDDRVMSVLVAELLRLDCSQDVRPQIRAIQDVVWRCASLDKVASPEATLATEETTDVAPAKFKLLPFRSLISDSDTLGC